MKSKKKIIILITFFIVLILIGWLDVKYADKISFGKFIPNNIKTYIKNTLFVIPSLKKEVKVKSEKIKELELEKIKTLNTWKKLNNNYFKNLDLKYFHKEEILINNKKIILQKLLLNQPDYYTWKMKSVGYVENYNNNIIYVTGDGNIFYVPEQNIFDKNLSLNQNLKINIINSNLKKFLSQNVSLPGKIGIKDVLIKDNLIFVSHINLKQKNCHNIEIIAGKININSIKFSKFFVYEECFKNGNIHSTGGRMVDYKTNEILFSIGEGLNRRLAQDKNSMFGKIIKINTNTLEHEIVSMGHRNPQGLFYDKKNNLVLSTEHGPAGGDEINLIQNNSTKIPNYGWPISSYGEHYPGKIAKYKEAGKLNDLFKEAPLNKSHKKYGFEEPLKYFVPSIGISEIIKVPNFAGIKSNNVFVVSAMGNNLNEGDKSIHYFILDENNEIKNYNYTAIGERIRDLKYIENLGVIIMVLENSPSLGIINLR